MLMKEVWKFLTRTLNLVSFFFFFRYLVSISGILDTKSIFKIFVLISFFFFFVCSQNTSNPQKGRHEHSWLKLFKWTKFLFNYSNFTQPVDIVRLNKVWIRKEKVRVRREVCLLSGTSRFACPVRRPRCHCSNYRLPRLNILCAREEAFSCSCTCTVASVYPPATDAYANKLALLSRFSPRKTTGHRILRASPASLPTSTRDSISLIKIGQSLYHAPRSWSKCFLIGSFTLVWLDWRSQL